MDSKIRALEREVKTDPNIGNMSRLTGLYRRLGSEENPGDLIKQIGDLFDQIFNYFDINPIVIDKEYKEYAGRSIEEKEIIDYTDQYWHLGKNSGRKDEGISFYSKERLEKLPNIIRRRYTLQQYYKKWERNSYTMFLIPLDPFENNEMMRYCLFDNSKKREEEILDGPPYE